MAVDCASLWRRAVYVLLSFGAGTTGEIAEICDGLVLVGGVARELLEEAAGQTGRDLAERKHLGLALGQKLSHGPSIRPAGGGPVDL